MHNILVTPGDGIGPEVIDATRRVLGWFTAKRGFQVQIEEGLVGGTAFEKVGRSDPDETIEKAKKADAVLFGAVGGPNWDHVPYEVRPEAGLLRLRKDLALFANLRPAICYPALAASSSVKARSRMTPSRSSRKATSAATPISLAAAEASRASSHVSVAANSFGRRAETEASMAEPSPHNAI